MRTYLKAFLFLALTASVLRQGGISLRPLKRLLPPPPGTA